LQTRNSGAPASLCLFAGVSVCLIVLVCMEYLCAVNETENAAKDLGCWMGYEGLRATDAVEKFNYINKSRVSNVCEVQRNESRRENPGWGVGENEEKRWQRGITCRRLCGTRNRRRFCFHSPTSPFWDLCVLSAPEKISHKDAIH